MTKTGETKTDETVKNVTGKNAAETGEMKKKGAEKAPLRAGSKREAGKPEKRIMFRKVRLGADKIVLDLSREYGLVLEGGGARGAFQMGAFKALREAGVRVRGVAGVSVGALNGALICMDEEEKGEEIWRNLSSSSILAAGEDRKEGLLKLIREKGMDITPLKELIRDTVDEDKIRRSRCELFVTTFSLSDKKLLDVDVKTMPEGQIADILLASAYFPLFRPEKLGGKLYTDGGGFNNVPLDVLVNRGYKDIIVIRIYGVGLDRERKVKLPEDANVSHIAPRESLGGILEFNKKRIRKNMVLGYLEAQRLLYGLAGRRYYIYAPCEEPYYFDKMMTEMELLEPFFGQAPGREAGKAPGGYRYYTEELFPFLAKKLKLSEDWDYRELYLEILEMLAARLKLFRYRVYTAGELARQIHRELLARSNTL